MSRMNGVMKKLAMPHQPCHSVSALILRTVAMPQSRQNGPLNVRNCIISTMPRCACTVAIRPGVAPQNRQWISRTGDATGHPPGAATGCGAGCFTYSTGEAYGPDPGPCGVVIPWSSPT